VFAQRKALSEHPYGTMKRGMDQGYFRLKGLQTVRGEFSLTVLAYNLKRVLNIVGVPRPLEALAQPGVCASLLLHEPPTKTLLSTRSAPPRGFFALEHSYDAAARQTHDHPLPTASFHTGSARVRRFTALPRPSCAGE